jgi:hypothetical protein
VLTGFELEREHPEGDQSVADETQTGFFLEQAVVEAEVDLSKRIHLELGFNIRTAAVRDAYVNYKVSDALELRAGRFKRPFSRLQLRSRGRIPFRDRGPFNNLMEDAQFVGRALGAMVWGEPIPGLRYYAALMDPAQIGSGIEGVDLMGRVVYDPAPWLSIGLAGLHKWSERFADGDSLSLHGLGGDVKVELGDLEVTLEADAVQNPNPAAVPGQSADPTRTPWAVGAIGYATYTFKLSKKWSIEPVLVLEWLDPDTDYTQDEQVRAVGGLSWNYQKNILRIMPQIELTRATGDASARSEIASETYYLMVAAEI